MSELYCKKPFRVEEKKNPASLGTWVQDADGEYFAMFGAVDVPEEESAQYARLFAAAPDLLEALEEAIEFAEQDFHALTPIGNAMVARWSDAIAKATGK